VFFSQNKSANSNFTHDFSDQRTEVTVKKRRHIVVISYRKNVGIDEGYCETCETVNFMLGSV